MIKTAQGQVSAARILGTPMPRNDANAETIRDYLVALLRDVWREGEGFDGKRPFGNSNWERDLYAPLVKHDYVKGHVSYVEGGNGYWVEYGDFNEEDADILVAQLIEELA